MDCEAAFPLLSVADALADGASFRCFSRRAWRATSPREGDSSSCAQAARTGPRLNTTSRTKKHDFGTETSPGDPRGNGAQFIVSSEVRRSKVTFVQCTCLEFWIVIAVPYVARQIRMKGVHCADKANRHFHARSARTAVPWTFLGSRPETKSARSSAMMRSMSAMTPSP